jgi:hypothetical protein
VINVQRRYPIALADLHPQQTLMGQCTACGHRVSLDHGAWLAQYGASMNLFYFYHRLSCQQCGARAPFTAFEVGPWPEAGPEDATVDGRSVPRPPREGAA